MTKENEPSPEQQGSKEQEPTISCRAARFNQERPAAQTYAQAQKAIYRADCEISAYRLKLEDVWHVAVLGIAIPQPLDKKIERILSAGEPAVLEPDIVKVLWQRHLEAAKKGPWVERHYR